MFGLTQQQKEQKDQQDVGLQETADTPEVQQEIQSVPRKALKKEKKEVENIGIAHIYASYNNTIIHITDLSGNTIAKASGGQITKYDRLEASPTVAMFAAKKAAEAAKEAGINAVYVRIRAPGGHNGPANPGPGSQASLRSISKAGIRIKSITDVTPVAHGGCRPAHGRRGRRV